MHQAEYELNKVPSGTTPKLIMYLLYLLSL
uniref:Uncharacterized protein n=1 Tax=Arundo donax TaxID=35708 RepID=A0A0A9BZJ3_ARUDO